MSPFISIYSCINKFVPKGLRFLTPFLYLADISKNGKYSLLKTKNSLKSNKGKVLFLASIDDPMVPYENNTGYIKKLYPNLNYIIVNNKGHNPNYKEEAVKKLQKFQNDIKAVPSDKITEFMNSINFHELGELDTSVMDKLIEFINL